MILRSRSPKSFAPLPVGILLTALAIGGAPVPATDTIVALGDSITKGRRPGVAAEETFSALLEKAVRDRGRDVTIVNAGIGGERTDQALLRLDKDVIARKPRLVTIMYGTNDSFVDPGRTGSRLPIDDFEKNLRTMVERLEQRGIGVVVMTEPCFGDGHRPNGLGEDPDLRLEAYMERTRRVAKELGVPLVDHHAHWTAAREQGVDPGDWTTDQCHPNPEGHRRLAEAILPAVLEALDKPVRGDGR